jgi:hypothetical protein
MIAGRSSRPMKRVHGALRATITDEVALAASTGEMNGVFGDDGHRLYLARHRFADAVMSTLLRPAAIRYPLWRPSSRKTLNVWCTETYRGNAVH